MALWIKESAPKVMWFTEAKLRGFQSFMGTKENRRKFQLKQKVGVKEQEQGSPIITLSCLFFWLHCECETGPIEVNSWKQRTSVRWIQVRLLEARLIYFKVCYI